MSENKSKLAQIREILFAKEVNLAQMKLEDGVTVIEAEVFEAEQAVMVITEDDQKIPVPVGEYKLEDGMILVVVEEGIISEIKAEEEVEEAPAEEEAVAANDKSESPLPKSIIESMVKETKFSKEAEDKIAELELKIAELSKVEVVVEEEVVELAQPIVHNPESQEVSTVKFHAAAGRTLSTQDKVMMKIANIKRK